MVADIFNPLVEKGCKSVSVVGNWEEASDKCDSRFAVVYPYPSRLETRHEHFRDWGLIGAFKSFPAMKEPHNYCPLTYCSAQCVRSMALLLVLYTTSTVHNVPTTLGFPYSFAGRSSHPARHNWLMLLIGNFQTPVLLPNARLHPRTSVASCKRTPTWC